MDNKDSNINLETILSQAHEWTFAGDFQLLNWMNKLSENLEKRATKTTENLNQLNNNIKSTHIALDNVANSLTALQYGNNFVECRVQDDDETSTTLVGSGNEGEKDNGVTENGNLSSKSILSPFLDNNLKVLRNCHEKYSLDIDDSDDEDENGKTEKTYIFQPINPYNERPLPHIFGSKEWYEKWHVGLSDDQQDNYYSGDEISEAFSESSSSGAGDNDSYESRSECASSFSVSNDNVGGNFEVRNATALAHSKVLNIDPTSESSSANSSNARMPSYIPRNVAVDDFHNRSDSISSTNSKTESSQVKSTVSKAASVGRPLLFKTNVVPYGDLFGETEPPDDLGSTTPSTPSIESHVSQRNPVNLFNDDDDEVYKHLVIAGNKRKESQVTQKTDTSENHKTVLPKLSPKVHNMENDKTDVQKPPPMSETVSSNKASKSVFVDNVDNSVFSSSVRPSPSIISTTPKNLFDDDDDDDDDFLSSFIKKQRLPETTKTMTAGSSTIKDGKDVDKENIFKDSRRSNSKNLFDDFDDNKIRQPSINLFNEDEYEKSDHLGFEKQHMIPKASEVKNSGRKQDSVSGGTKQIISNILKSNLFDDNDDDDDDELFKTKPTRSSSILIKPDTIEPNHKSTNESKQDSLSAEPKSSTSAVIDEKKEITFQNSPYSQSVVANVNKSDSSKASLLLDRNSSDLFVDVKDDNIFLPTKPSKEQSPEEKQMPSKVVSDTAGEVLKNIFEDEESEKRSHKFSTSKETFTKLVEEKQMPSNVISSSVGPLQNIFGDDESDELSNEFSTSNKKSDSNLSKVEQISSKIIHSSVENLKNNFENENPVAIVNELTTSTMKNTSKLSKEEQMLSKSIPSSVGNLQNDFENEEAETYNNKSIPIAEKNVSQPPIESNNQDRLSKDNVMDDKGKEGAVADLEKETADDLNTLNIVSEGNISNYPQPISVDEDIGEILDDQNHSSAQILSVQQSQTLSKESITALGNEIPKQSNEIASTSKMYDFNTSLLFDEPPDDNEFFENLGKSAQNTNTKYNSFDLENELYPEPDLPKIPPTTEKSSEYKGLQLFSDIPPEDSDFDDFTPQKPEYKVFYDDFSETLEAIGRNSNQVIVRESGETPVDVNAIVKDKDIVDHQVQDQIGGMDVKSTSNSSINRPIAKLQMPNININVQALLPSKAGRTTPGQTVLRRKNEETPKKDNTNDRMTSVQLDQKQEITSSKESTIHSTPETEHILPSMNKNRIRAPPNRRPSTRRARQENYRKSLLEEERIINEIEKTVKDDMDKMNITTMQSQKESLPIEDTHKIGKVNKTENEPKAHIIAEDNIFKTTKDPQGIGQSQNINQVLEQKEKSNTPKSAAKTSYTFFDEDGDEDNDDLFQSIATVKSGKSQTAPPQAAPLNNASATSFQKDLNKALAGLQSSGISQKISPLKGEMSSSSKKIFENSSESDDDLFATLGTSKKVKRDKDKQSLDSSEIGISTAKITNAKIDSSPILERSTPSILAKDSLTKTQASIFSDISDDDDDFLNKSSKKLVPESSKSLGPPEIGISKPKTTNPKIDTSGIVERSTPSILAKDRLTKTQTSIFSDDSDDDDDFLKTSSKKLVPESSKSKVTSNTARGASIFSDIDSDDDLFDVNRKVNTKTNRIQREAVPVSAETKERTKQTVADNPLADLL